MKYQIEDCSATSVLVVAIDVDGIIHSEWLIKFMFQPVGRYNVESIEYSEYDSEGELTAKGGNFYHSQLCTHRNRQGDIVTCSRYSGYERVDAEWLKTRYASSEVRLYSRGDMSLIEEMAQISKRLGG